ncbi:MAG: peptidylprolyl isomerase [Verrucomicrobiales bacterium]|nr:peptidylprolyl isomerase [Verrucomicrobiales bacterium]
MQILRPLLILSFALPAFAQQPAAPPAAPAPVPAPAAAPAPPPAPAPGAPAGAPLLPPPATPAPAPLGPFKDIKERHSYGLGTFLGNREKTNAAANPDKPGLNAAEILAGLQDGLAGAKSLDYTNGLAMAGQIKRSGVDIDQAVLVEAVRTALENKEAKIPAPDVQTIMQEIQTSIQQRQAAKQKEEATKNLELSNAWLAENAKKEGVKTSPSGLQYKIENPGAGKAPAPKDLVTVNISGTNTEGAEFDKSPAGAPARRSLAAMPKGLQEGILMLKAGGKGSFWVPPVLGYGENPRGAVLKGNSVLHYEVELISSETPPPSAAPSVSGQRPVSAVTPPVAVDIPPAPGKAVSAPVQVPPPPVTPLKPGASLPPPPAPPAAPVPPPAPAPTPAK